MRTTYRTFALVAATFLLAACSDAPVQPPDAAPPQPSAAAGTSPIARWIEEYVVDFADSYFLFACTADGAVAEDPDQGELVRMEGQMYVRNVLTQDAGGNYHYTWRTMPIDMRGTGVASGEEFRVTERQTGGSNQTPRTTAGRYRTVQSFVGLETGRRFSLVTAGHYTLDANGDLVSARDTTTLECRP